MKRLIAVMLCVVLLLGPLDVIPAAASEALVEYVRAVPQYPVMNAQTYSSSSFLNAYIGSDNNSIYNIAPAFRKQSESSGASSMPGNLTFGTSFTHRNDSNTYAMYYEYDFEDALVPALKKGDLHVCFVANLTNDRHWNIDRHLDTWTAYPVTWLRTYQDVELIEHTTKDYSRDGTWTMGRNQFIPIPARQYQDRLWFRAFAQVCTCGSSKVSNVSIVLADVAGPAVKSIYTSGVRNGVVMERLREFRGGDKIHIHLEFDEEIRFATDTAMALSSAPKLKLQLKRVSDNMIDTAEASLIALKNKTLTFEYVVPTDQAIEHYFDSIEPYLNQTSWISRNDDFDVRLFGPRVAGSATYISHTQKTSSLIVDLAGNPVHTGRSVRTLERATLIDSIPPRVIKADVFREDAFIPAGELSRRDVFAGSYDSIGLTATFSEPLYLIRLADNQRIKLDSTSIHTPNLVAELNITANGSDPLIAHATAITDLWDGKKGVDRVHFSFWMNEDLSITAAPLKFDGKDLPIGINRIYLENDEYILTDALGNPYDAARQLINTPPGSRVLPERQLWLDTLTPLVGTTLTYDGFTYEPLRYESGDLSSFYIPITISDQNLHGEEYMSLTNGCTATFRWVPDYAGTVHYSFEYAVTGSAAKPPDSAYRQGSMNKTFTFPQLDGGNYIHMRLLEGGEFRAVGSALVIVAYDNAGNLTSRQLPIELNLDRVAPRIIQGMVSKKFYDGAGRLSTAFTIEDHSQDLNIKYQWTAQGASPDTEDWSVVDLYTSDGTELKYHRFSLERAIAVGTDFSGTLHIRVTDEGDNVSTASFNHVYSLHVPVTDIEFATNPSTPLDLHTMKLLPPTRGKDTGAAYSTFVLVRAITMNGDPLYWFREFQWFNSSGTPLITQPIDLFNPVTGPAGWRVFEWVKFTGGSHTFWEWPLDWHWINKPTVQLKDQLKQYGKVEVAIVSRNHTSMDKYHLDPAIDLFSINQFDVFYASDDLLGPGDRIHSVTVTPLTTVSHVIFSAPDEVLASLPTGIAMPSSLDGAVFRVTLEPLLFSKAYGLTDIDFTSSDTRLALYKTGSGAPTTPIYTTPLVAKNVQDIVFPLDVATESGSYKVVVSVRAKASGRVDSSEFTNINIDRRALDTYGVTEVMTQHNLGGTTLKLTTPYDIAPNIRTSELYVSAADVSSQTVNFKAGITALPYGAENHYAAYIRVWNATASTLDSTDPLYIPKEDYKWVYIPESRQYYTTQLRSSTRDSIVAALGSSDASIAACLPLIPGENMINYEIALANGHSTGVQSLLVWASDDLPTLNMGLSPQKSVGNTNGSITASVLMLNSTAVAPDGLTLGLLGASVEQMEELNTHRTVPLMTNGDYTFYTYDKYHNLGLDTFSIDYIDVTPPTLSVINQTTAGTSTFSLAATISDNSSAESSRLFFSYDDAYSEVLGVPTGSVFAVPQDAEWKATGVSPSGLYATSCITSESTRAFSIQGAFKHDTRSGATTIDRTLTLYAIDGAGNKSSEWTATISAANRPATYLGGALVDGGFRATFNQPVLLINPSEATLSPAYSLHKGHLPFFSNGLYPLDFIDLFGAHGKEAIAIDHYSALYNHSVAISESTPTNQDVRVLINAAFNPNITIGVPDSIPGATIEKLYDAVGNIVGANITMAQNGAIPFALKPKDLAFASLDRVVEVRNIDKTPPNVALSWVYTSPVVDGETSGEVIVSLDADKDIVPILGTTTTHTFRLDSQGSYTFHYRDLAGNTGSIEAILPVTIVEKERQPLDTTPPQYTFAIYRGGTKLKGYTQDEYEALADITLAFPLFSDMLQLRFEVSDENQTWLTVKDITAMSETAVVYNGTTVTVTDNAQFTVVIRDAMGHETLVPININSADNTPPTGTITYEKTGLYTVRAYLNLSDDRPGTVTLRTTEGVKLETEGTHKGKYYYEFMDNGSFSFNFVDAAGNSGSTIAIVTSLDMSSPVGSITEWSPYHIDAQGNPHKTHLSSIPTNSDVSVYIRFNKPIRSITPTIVNSYGSLDHVSVTHTSDSAVVVFRQNAEVRLRFTALNGKTGHTVLRADIIDKVAPEISATQTATNSRFVTFAFTANEPVVLEDAEGRGVPATSFSRTFYLNGDYALKFTDLAGNSTTVIVSITGIDRTPPEITLRGLPATRETIAAYNSTHGTALEHTMTPGPLSIYVSLNEPGKVSFRGKSYTVSIAQVINLQISANGSYELVATDLAGNATTYKFKVDCLDQTPPQVKFLSETVVIRQGSTLSEFEHAVLAHTTVTDNFDPNPTAYIPWWHMLSEEQLNTPGTYRIWVYASDQAGNEGSAGLYVRVLDKNTPELWINGVFAQPSETVFVFGRGSREIYLTLGNLPSGPGGSEPYSMYWKFGLNTPGQMKNAQVFTESFVAPRDGFYTIYVVTQSRASFTVYIYLQS